MAGAEKVITITPLVLELSPEDVGLLNKITSRRTPTATGPEPHSSR